jgi:CheY-like chemotaxis protein
MPPEVQEHIFEPFFTTRHTRGTGLGLAQAAKAVERHGGSIQVRSAPGEGTTFSLTFPLAVPVSVTRAEPLTRAAQAIRPLHVLVVDDEPANAQLAATVLGLVGHLVTIAHSGGEALTHLARQRFDAVVSDLGLGAGINGWALAARVKQCWPGTVFVLVTGWSASIDAEEARAAGVATVIAKPYRLSVLQQALAAV